MHSPSLDGLGTTVTARAWSFTRSQRRLLGASVPHQVEVIECVACSDLPGAEKRATRINCCSQVVQVGATANGRPGVQFFRCKDRLCQICSRYRRLAAAEKVTAMIASMQSPKLLTLTLAATDRPLHETLDRLVDRYRALRRRPLWKREVRGAAAVIEVTRGATDRHWHVHLHVLVDMEYVPQATLSSEWLCTTGDSYIVDVRSVASGPKAARYMSKYAAKGCDTSKLDAGHLVEYVAAMYRRRMFIATGNLHGLQADRDDWESRHQPVGETLSVARIRKAAQQQCLAAQRVLRLMASAGGLPALFATDAPCPLEPLSDEEWQSKYGREFPRLLRSCKRWIENNGPLLLPGPPPFTREQMRFAAGVNGRGEDCGSPRSRIAAARAGDGPAAR